MEARLSAVQKGIWWLLAGSLVLLVVGRPEPRNRSVREALSELTTFQAGFDRAALETELRQHAEGQGALPLSTIAGTMSRFGGRALEVVEGAPPIKPMSTARLDTLERVRLHALPEATLTIGTADPSALAAALSWRLSRLESEAPIMLASVTLKPSSFSKAAAESEQSVAQARLRVLEQEREVAQATRKYETAVAIFDARRKRQLPWKDLVEFYDARNAARAALDEKTVTLKQSKESYESEAQRVLSQSAAPEPAAEQRDVADAEVVLSQQRRPIRMSIPLLVSKRDVPVPPLRGGSFPATRAAGLWDEVKSLPPQRAIPAVESEFNWHYRHVDLLGLKVGGMTLLQVLPCVLVALLALLFVRIRSATTTYSPFNPTVGALPSVGLKSRLIELLVVVLLPFLAAVSCALALLMIGQVPVLPALAAVACFALGGATFVRLGDLKGLVESVVRHSSYPPPQRT